MLERKLPGEGTIKEKGLVKASKSNGRQCRPLTRKTWSSNMKSEGSTTITETNTHLVPIHHHPILLSTFCPIFILRERVFWHTNVIHTFKATLHADLTVWTWSGQVHQVQALPEPRTRLWVQFSPNAEPCTRPGSSSPRFGSEPKFRTDLWQPYVDMMDFSQIDDPNTDHSIDDKFSTYTTAPFGPEKVGVAKILAFWEVSPHYLPCSLPNLMPCTT